jgi:hypothetical protein
LNVPDAVGVPLIVATLPAQVPVTPAGKPAKVAPVAPVVAKLIVVNCCINTNRLIGSCSNGILWLTVIVPVVVAGGHPPVVVTV